MVAKPIASAAGAVSRPLAGSWTLSLSWQSAPAQDSPVQPRQPPQTP